MDDRDELFEALVLHCATRSGAVRRRRWGEDLYVVGSRVFVFLGSASDPSVTVKVARERQGRLVEHPFVRRARFVGRLGWLTVRVRDARSLGLALELIDHSYELTVVGRRR